MLRVLHAVPNMNSGGIENYIMNMYRGMNAEEIQFDFLMHHNARGYFDDEIEARGGRIFRLPVLDDKNLLSYRRQLADLFSGNDWKIVHGHAASLAIFYLGAAERAGVPVRIAHSHGTSYLRTPKGYMKRVMFKGAKRHANVRLACSTEAGRYLFGDESFHLAKNAINASRFMFNADARLRIREKLNIGTDDFVVGHVGRYNLQKNHAFLVDAFSDLLVLRPESKLVLVGTGELERSVHEKVAKLGISDRVIFQSVTSEPEAFYSAMDAFVLPSRFEGLPLVGIEAQCAGLPCFFSADITKEVEISELATFLDLKEGTTAWAEAIAATKTIENRTGYAACAIDHGFDCDSNNETMRRFYLEAAKRGASVDSLLD